MLSISGGLYDTQGDLDVIGELTIIGAGAGVSIIDASGLSSSVDRVLNVNSFATLDLQRVTLMMGHAVNTPNQWNGGTIRVQDYGELHLSYSAIVSNQTGNNGNGGGIYFDRYASGAIKASVITSNSAANTAGGIYLASSTDTGGTVTIETTIVANNTDSLGNNPNIFVGANRTLSSLGNNRFATGVTGFTQALTDHIGSVDYVVTSVADTWDVTHGASKLSLREAINLAKTTGVRKSGCRLGILYLRASAPPPQVRLK